MKKIVQSLTLILLLALTPFNSFSNYENDLHSWLDSTLTAEQIDWNATETEFFALSKELFKKNTSVTDILAHILKKSGKRQKKFEKTKESYPSLKKLTAISTTLFEKMALKSILLVKTNGEWDNFNSATRLSIFFDYVNQWGLNIDTPKEIGADLLKLNQYVENETLSKKLIIITLAQKILTQNNYIKQSDIAQKAYHKVKYYSKPKKKTAEEEVQDINEEEVSKGEMTEIEPSFLGGSQGMTEFIKSNVSYPQSAKEMGEQGIQYVKFVIEKDGSITNPVIRKGTNEILSKEAIRVVESMPKWKPGEQNGKKVRVNFTLPIHFRLG